MYSFENKNKINMERIFHIIIVEILLLQIAIKGLTVKSTDPAIVARATTYSGKEVRIVHVVSDEALAEYAEHWRNGKICNNGESKSTSK